MLLLTLAGELDERYKVGGKLHFKLVWPNRAGKKNFNEWKQATNPILEPMRLVAGYEPVEVNFQASRLTSTRILGSLSHFPYVASRPAWLYPKILVLTPNRLRSGKRLGRFGERRGVQARCWRCWCWCGQLQCRADLGC